MSCRPSLIAGLVAAAALALVAGLTVSVLGALFNPGTAVKLAATALSLVYVLFVFRQARARTGRLVALSAWAASSLCAWWMLPSTALYLLVQAGSIWLIRSLFVYSSLLPALADLALSAFSAIAFTWAFTRTGSVFLATWSYFLLQALWVLIPRRLTAPLKGRQSESDNDSFEHARRRADAALRQLFSHNG